MNEKLFAVTSAWNKAMTQENQVYTPIGSYIAMILDDCPLIHKQDVEKKCRCLRIIAEEIQEESPNVDVIIRSSFFGSGTQISAFGAVLLAYGADLSLEVDRQKTVDSINSLIEVLTSGWTQMS